MFHVDDAASDDESENDVTESSRGDDVKHLTVCLFHQNLHQNLTKYE